MARRGVASLLGGDVDGRTVPVVRDLRVDGLVLNPEDFNMYHSDANPMKGGRNFTYYANPEYDKLINEAVVTTDRDREIKLERQAAELLWRDAAVVVNGRIVDKFVGRKDVKGFVYLGDRVSFRYYDMYRER
jgi:ABC-type transport system substrate-binding protein